MTTHLRSCFLALSLALIPSLNLTAQWEELCDGYQIDIQPLPSPQSPEEDFTDYFDLDSFNEDISQKIIAALNIHGSSFEIVIKISDSFVRAKIRRHSFSHESAPDPDCAVFVQGFHDKVQSSSSSGSSSDRFVEEDIEGEVVPPIGETPEEDGIEEDGILVEDGATPAWTEDMAYQQITLHISREDIDAMRPLAERLIALKADAATALSEELCNIPSHEEENLVTFLSGLHEGFWKDQAGKGKIAALIQAFDEISDDPYVYFEWLDNSQYLDDHQYWRGGSWGEIIDYCNTRCTLSIQD
jgi:hypothetical protein